MKKVLLLLMITVFCFPLSIFAQNPYAKGAKFTFKVHSYSHFIGRTSSSESDKTYYRDWYVIDYDPVSQISQIQTSDRTAEWDNYNNTPIDTFWIKPYNEYAFLESKDNGNTWSFFYSSDGTPQTGNQAFCGKSMKTYYYSESQGGPSSVYAPDGTKISSDNESNKKRTWTELGLSKVYMYSHSDKTDNISTTEYDMELIFASIPGKKDYYDGSKYQKPICELCVGIYSPSFKYQPEESRYINDAHGAISLQYKKDEHAVGYKIYALCLDNFMGGYVTNSFPFSSPTYYNVDLSDDVKNIGVNGSTSFCYLNSAGLSLVDVMGGQWLFFVIPYNEIYFNNDQLVEFVNEINGKDYSTAYAYVVEKLNSLQSKFPGVYLNIGDNQYVWQSDLTAIENIDISVKDLQKGTPSTDKYNLWGQKIPQSQKGIYIQNGRLYYEKE